MKDRKLRGLWICAGIVLLATILVPVSRAQEIDPDAIRKTLEESWRSVRTLEAHGVQFAADARGERTTRQGVWSSSFEFYHAPGARRALNVQQFRPDGKFESGEYIREDGRKSYRLQSFPGHADLIDEMTISTQQDTSLAQRSMLNSLFVWCWTPAGRATHTILDQDCRYESVRDADGRSLVRVAIPRHNLVLDLDPSVGYSARTIRLGDDVTFTVTRFEQFEGVWIPMRGFEDHRKSPVPGALRHEGFEVSQMRVNAPIPESTFTLAKPPRGALVSDQTTGKSRVQGGSKARTELFRANPSLNEPVNDPARPAARATVPPVREPGFSSPWALALFAVAGLSLGGAWMLRSRLA